MSLQTRVLETVRLIPAGMGPCLRGLPVVAPWASRFNKHLRRAPYEQADGHKLIYGSQPPRDSFHFCLYVTHGETEAQGG